MRSTETWLRQTSKSTRFCQRIRFQSAKQPRKPYRIGSTESNRATRIVFRWRISDFLSIHLQIFRVLSGLEPPLNWLVSRLRACRWSQRGSLLPTARLGHSEVSAHLTKKSVRRNIRISANQIPGELNSQRHFRRHFSPVQTMLQEAVWRS